MADLGKILIIDDNEDVLLALNLLLRPKAEKVKTMRSPERLVHAMTDFRPDLVLLDMNFTRDTVSGQEGMECLQAILKLDPGAVVIMMTAYADTEKAVQAIKAGATDFVSKPYDNDKLLATLHSAMKLRRLQADAARLQERVEALSAEREEARPRLIGESDCMKRVAGLLGQIGGLFVRIDVGAVPDTLFESELFGHEKGAFTDAHQGKKGRMELAHGGTLFLDEVGNLSPSAQAKLLTALEKKRIVRVGGTKEIPIDVRLICATNADLHTQVADGRFRQDLFYRINTVEIHIPPLRERGHDIQLLADFFLEKYARKYHKPVKGIARDARNKLQQYPWPGNVRELQHAIERAVVLNHDDLLRADDFLLYPTPAKAAPETLNLQELERQAVSRALQLSGGHLNQAAELLGITRYALYRKIENLGL